MSDKYNEIYHTARSGFNGDASIWDRLYQYVCENPNELFAVSAPRKWSLAHQLIFHGATSTFERILHLYSERNNPIDIFSLSKDVPQPKTILDIATERKTYYPNQYESIVHLFNQDKFIKACKAYNWAMIDEMLEKYPQLLNEKPPYYCNYFVHYLVLHRDAQKFAQYNRGQNRLKLDLKNSDNKTPLELAREINASNIVALITGSTTTPPAPQAPQRKASQLVKSNDELERDEDEDDRLDRDEDDDEKPPPPPATVTKPPTATTASYPAAGVVSKNANSQPPASTASRPTASSHSSAAITTVAPTFKHPSDVLGSLSSASIPIDAVITRATCLLTGKIFEDPVIATDGLTYERRAIMKYHRENRYSPATGEVLDDIYIDNTHMKHLVDTLREEKAIP